MKNQAGKVLELISESQKAFAEKDWPLASRLNFDLAQTLLAKKYDRPETLATSARKYLGSLVGDGRFILEPNRQESPNLSEGIEKFENLFENSPSKIKELISPILNEIREIRLFALKDEAITNNKCAAALRRIARPDISIEITSKGLALSPLNYYFLATRSAAHSDLGYYDLAILDAEKALEFSPKDKKLSSLTTLSRAYRLRFLKNGVLNDGENSVNAALQALDLERSAKTANTFISAAQVFEPDRYSDLIAELEGKYPNLARGLDSEALKIANEVSTALKPQVQIVLQDEGGLNALEIMEIWQRHNGVLEKKYIEEFLNHPSISIFLESDIQTLEVIFREFRKLSDAGAFLVQAPAENISNFLSAYNSHDSEEFDDDLEVGFLAPRVDSLIGTDDIDFNADDAEYL
jgi:hypothetical protein